MRAMTEIAKYADDVIRIPKTDEILSPVLAGIPMQLYAYHVADMLGLRDRPAPQPGEERNSGIADDSQRGPRPARAGVSVQAL